MQNENGYFESVFDNVKIFDEAFAPYTDELGLTIEELEQCGRKVEWLVEELIPLRYVTLLYGHGGVGKSTLALHLCATIAGGGDSWLGCNVARNGTVFYVDFERQEDSIAERARALKVEVPDNWKKFCRYLNGDQFRGRKAVEYDRLIQYAERHKAALIVIDSFGLICRGDISDATPVISVLEQLQDVANRTGAAVVVIDHVAKQSDGDPTPYGSVYKLNYARSALLLHNEANVLELKLRKANYATAGRKWYLAINYTDDGTITVTESERTTEAGRRRKFILDYVQKHPKGVTVTDLSQAVNAEFGNINERALYRDINSLTDFLHFERGKKGQQGWVYPRQMEPW